MTPAAVMLFPGPRGICVPIDRLGGTEVGDGRGHRVLVRETHLTNKYCYTVAILYSSVQRGSNPLAKNGGICGFMKQAITTNESLWTKTRQKLMMGDRHTHTQTDAKISNARITF